MPDIPAPSRSHRRKMVAALFWKEWQEQRWRFGLAAVVWSGLLAGLLRAQIIPTKESLNLLYWPAGLLLLLFLSMGPVASERSNHTWEFLIAQPVRSLEVLRAKWLMGISLLVSVVLISALAGMLALLSRDLSFRTREMGAWLSIEGALRVGLFAVKAACALALCYTPLFFILVRARNEFAAGLAGVLILLLLHVWFAVAHSAFEDHHLLWTGIPNPVSLLFFLVDAKYQEWWWPAFYLNLCLWFVLPLIWLAWKSRKKAMWHE